MKTFLLALLLITPAWAGEDVWIGQPLDRTGDQMKVIVTTYDTYEELNEAGGYPPGTVRAYTFVRWHGICWIHVMKMDPVYKQTRRFEEWGHRCRILHRDGLFAAGDDTTPVLPGHTDAQVVLQHALLARIASKPSGPLAECQCPRPLRPSPRPLSSPGRG